MRSTQAGAVEINAIAAQPAITAASDKFTRYAWHKLTYDTEELHQPIPVVNNLLLPRLSVGSLCAHVAEITVSAEGKLKVDRVTVAVDPHYVVNPLTTAGDVKDLVYGFPTFSADIKSLW